MRGTPGGVGPHVAALGGCFNLIPERREIISMTVGEIISITVAVLVRDPKQQRLVNARLDLLRT